MFTKILQIKLVVVLKYVCKAFDVPLTSLPRTQAVYV